MRKWHRYQINPGKKQAYGGIDTTFDDHKRSMGGYSCREGYGTREEFFKKYIFEGDRRMKHYHQCLADSIKITDRILSIGSGRCANELFFVDKGFNILCSDLGQPCKDETRRLFPELMFKNIDILSDIIDGGFDCVISFSMFYLFGQEKILDLFKKIYGLIKPGGKFILDPGAAEDNSITYIIDEVICPLEARIAGLLRWRNPFIISKKHHGYRSRNNEIISIAKKAGFTFNDLSAGDYLTETERSRIFGRLPIKLREAVGRHAPYVRIFTFVKEKNAGALKRGDHE